jgi:hypothetical protein
MFLANLLQRPRHLLIWFLALTLLLGITYDETEQADRRVVALDIATGKQRDVFVAEKPKGIEDLTLSPDGRSHDPGKFVGVLVAG